jgi:hypothetical protein
VTKTVSFALLLMLTYDFREDTIKTRKIVLGVVYINKSNICARLLREKGDDPYFLGGRGRF